MKELLDKLLTIFAELDDTDAISGVHTLRHLHNISDTTWNRIVELEQMEQWLDALREYDLMRLNIGNSDIWGKRYQFGSDINVHMTEVDDTMETEDASITQTHSQHLNEEPGSTIIEESTESNFRNVHQDDADDLSHFYENTDDIENIKDSSDRRHWKLMSFVERGKLKCLTEMGHTKLALDEVYR